MMDLISRNVDVVYIPVPWSIYGIGYPPSGSKLPTIRISLRQKAQDRLQSEGSLYYQMLAPHGCVKSRRGRELVYMLWSTQISMENK